MTQPDLDPKDRLQSARDTPLTDPRQFDILQFGPGKRGPNAI
jgi:hypothetical protein